MEITWLHTAVAIKVCLPFGNIYKEDSSSFVFLPTDQKVMILREERSCPGASQIVQW